LGSTGTSFSGAEPLTAPRSTEPAPCP
jgi:hypothetical protein